MVTSGPDRDIKTLSVLEQARGMVYSSDVLDKVRFYRALCKSLEWEAPREVLSTLIDYLCEHKRKVANVLPDVLPCEYKERTFLSESDLKEISQLSLDLQILYVITTIHSGFVSWEDQLKREGWIVGAKRKDDDFVTGIKKKLLRFFGTDHQPEAGPVLPKIETVLNVWNSHPDKNRYLELFYMMEEPRFIYMSAEVPLGHLRPMLTLNQEAYGFMPAEAESIKLDSDSCYIVESADIVNRSDLRIDNFLRTNYGLNLDDLSLDELRSYVGLDVFGFVGLVMNTALDEQFLYSDFIQKFVDNSITLLGDNSDNSRVFTASKNSIYLVEFDRGLRIRPTIKLCL